MSLRGGRRAAAVCAGLVVGLAAFLAPPSVAMLDVSGLGHEWDGYSLALAPRAENLRDARRLELVRDNLPTDVKLHYVMGSSELTSPVPQNPGTWFASHSSDLVLFLSGRGYVQSLSHAMELASVAPKLKTPKVTLILSPQWFSASGVGVKAFGEVFSHSFYESMLKNPDLSVQTKARIVARVRELRGPSPVPRPDLVVQSRMNVFRERFRADLDLLQLPVPAKHEATPVATVDWNREVRLAQDEGASVSHNQFYVADSYYARYVEPKLVSMEGSMGSQDYLTSPEYDDLDIFLAVAKEVHVEVMLVSVPMNGWLHDYLGYPAAARAKYYEKIRDIARTAGVRLADFSGGEYEPYFLYDIMHLGWKGWLDVTRACVEFESAA